ncbi:Smr domain-containing protein [Acrodontium crateriforme]|uniref:Smr domain-containing protein n=1 Tax=Acrodontium crateriforme TaxID=150365 RepID=A0AAQ3M638_9PEZI|nr:Smr domain-containing protein [Acrodontium crateriforme]
MSEQEIISKSSLSTADGKMTDPTFAEFIKRIRNLDYKRKDELLRLVKRRLAVQTLEEGARRAEIQGKLNRGSVKAAKSTSTASQHENNRLPAARTLYPGGVEQFETDFEEPVCFRAVEAVMETFYHFCIRLSHEENSSIMPESEVTDSTYSKYVLFPRVGMLNHSCRPNAEASFNSQSRMMIVRAITQIECGDEITIAYQNPFKARLQRWECLGFECYSFNHGPSSNAEQEYDRLRDLARKEQGEHQHYAAQSQQAYQRGDGGEASRLSGLSKQHAAKADQYNKQASEYIFRENNAVGKVADDTIDLHGQFVEEAEEIVEQRIRYARQNGQNHLHIIVGKGNHSPGHIQKIKPRVEQICQEMGLQYHTEQNEGRIFVDLSGGNGQGHSYDYQQHHQPQHQDYGKPHYETAYPMANSGYPGAQQNMQYGGQPGRPQQQMGMQQQQQDEGIACCGIKICVVM